MTNVCASVDVMHCSQCVRQVFAHNDADHLEAVLRASIAEGQPRTRRPWRKVLVVVEGIYSMEGEIVDLAAVVAVAKKYKVRQRRPLFKLWDWWTAANLDACAASACTCLRPPHVQAVLWTWSGQEPQSECAGRGRARAALCARRTPLHTSMSAPVRPGVPVPGRGAQHRRAGRGRARRVRGVRRGPRGHRHHDGDLHKVVRLLWRLHRG